MTRAAKLIDGLSTYQPRVTCDLSLDQFVFNFCLPSYGCSLHSSLQYQDGVAAARTLLVEMMADLDEEVAELFLMEEEVRNVAEVVDGLDTALKPRGRNDKTIVPYSGWRPKLAVRLGVKGRC